MALAPSLQSVVGSLNTNVNAPDVVQAFSDAFNSRAVIAPLGVKQIGAFAFDYHGNDEVDMENEVTDHWLEDNTAVQDHIGVKPVMITLRGYVSELVLSTAASASISAALGTVQSGLSQVDAYLGKYTPGATDALLKSVTQAQNIAIQIEQSLARAAQLASFFQANPSMNKQQKAYFQLSSLRIARVVFTVFTPFQVFDNMTITNLRAIQSEKTRTMSDFTVTMKQLQFSEDISLANFNAQNAGRAAGSAQPLTQNGSTTGAILFDKVTGAAKTVATAIKSAFPPALRTLQ